MQLLIDTTQESPASLRQLSSILLELAIHAAADARDTLPQLEEPSINGQGEPIILTRAIDAQPLAAPATDPAQLNPAEVFAQLSGRAPRVPAGTTLDPTLPASSPAAVVPPAPVLAAVVPITDGTPTTATGDAAVSADRDSENIPWDERVHSESRKKNADGSWRYRRNLDAAVKAAVYAELKAAHGVQAPLVPTAPPAPPAPPAAPPAPSTVLPFPGAPQMPLPVSNGVHVGLPNAPQSGIVPAANFRELMQKINQALANGRMTQAQLALACTGAGVESITALAAQPALVPTVDAAISAILGAVAA